MTELQFPNILGQYNQGYDRGRSQLADKLAGQAYSAQGGDRQSLLGQLAGVNPQLAVGLGNSLQTQDQNQQKFAQAQQVDHAKKLNGAARYMLAAYQSGDPARIQGSWQAVRPYLADLTGKTPPDQFDPAMLPAMYKIIGQSGGMPEQKPIQLSNGAQLVDQSGKVLADNPLEQHDTGELATLRAMQQDPSLLATYRQAHPIKPSGDGGAGAEMLTPDAQALVAAATAHGYAIPMTSMGYGKAGAKAKADQLNALAKRAKDSGVSPDQFVSLMVQGKTATAGLLGIQKTYASVAGWEASAAKQAQIALDMSNKVDRSGVPIFNKWLLAGRQGTGDVAVAQFNNTTNTLAEEYAKVMGGGNASATDSARNLAHSMMNSAMTGPQFAGVVQKMQQEMAARKHALQENIQAQRDSIVGNEGANVGGWSGQATPQQPPASQQGGWSIEPVQ